MQDGHSCRPSSRSRRRGRGARPCGLAGSQSGAETNNPDCDPHFCQSPRGFLFPR
jgi:hypothetical protein